MKRVLVLTAALAAICSTSFAEPQPQQHVTPSWHGLTGLYVVPTARTMSKGQLGMGYNESKHVEYIGSARFSDRQVRAGLTYGVLDSLEIYGSYCRDLVDIGDNFSPQLSHQTFNQFGFKWRFLDETRRRPAFAFAIRDIGNDMQDVDVLKKVNNGRKYFLLASKRVVEDEATGRFLDAHAGITQDELRTSALFGVELAVSPTMSYIAEGMWDSPYMNFRSIYSHADLQGQDTQPGRFIFDMGLRFYPDLLPGIVVDAGFIGDGSVEFSFGFSYVSKI